MKQTEKIPANGSIVIKNEWQNGQIVHIAIKSTTDVKVILISDRNFESLFDENKGYDDGGQDIIFEKCKNDSIGIVTVKGIRNLLIINENSAECSVEVDIDAYPAMNSYVNWKNPPTSATSGLM